MRAFASRAHDVDGRRFGPTRFHGHDKQIDRRMRRSKTAMHALQSW
jgi:hypothetical protein